jgi:hypothetical protein
MNEQLNNELELERQKNNGLNEELTLTKQLVAQLEIKNTRLNQQQAALQQQHQQQQQQSLSRLSSDKELQSTPYVVIAASRPLISHFFVLVPLQ